MKYLHLIWAGLFRRKVRTVLTLLSIVVSAASIFDGQIGGGGQVR